MSPTDALAVLRAASWSPGVGTAGHPARDQIKAALAVLREHRVDVAQALAGLVDTAVTCPLCSHIRIPIQGTGTGPSSKPRKGS